MFNSLQRVHALERGIDAGRAVGPGPYLTDLDEHGQCRWQNEIRFQHLKIGYDFKISGIFNASRS